MALDASRRLAYLAWITVCLVWGTTYLAIRIALETIPPALLGGLRYTAAGLLLVAVLMLRGVPLPRRVHWPGLVLLGLLFIGLGNGAVIWAEQWVPSGIAAVVIATSPFWMSGIEALVPGGERLGRRGVTGMVIGFGGILLLVWPDLVAGGADGGYFAAGLVALQVAEIGWSCGSAYSKRHARNEHPVAAAALQMLFGGLMMLALGTLRGEWRDLSFNTRTLAAEVYLTLVGSIVAFTAYLYALKHLPVSTVSSYAYVNPIIAVLLGAAVLAEPLSPRIALASAIVLAGIAVTQSAERGTTAGRTAPRLPSWFRARRAAAIPPDDR